MRKTLFTILVTSLSILLLNCSSPKENKTLSNSDISPGTAKIVGTITEIDPVTDTGNLSGPCSKAPCIALVKVTSAIYGSAFPQFTFGKEVRIKFLFTLKKTTKELFPNMEEEYPGLKVGDEFTATVAHVENIDETAPKFQIYGYEKN
ncbi:MAG: hypothetical protein HKP17_09740 [Ignavibacteriaceae bacterium]|nr:hypothetical protein [Ignavibacteriaceae bacterium]